MKWKALAFAASVAVVSSPAVADWHYFSFGDLGNDDYASIAVVQGGGYTFGLQCLDGGLRVAYGTPEPMGDFEWALLGKLNPTLAVKVDDKDPFFVFSWFERVDDKERVSGIAQEDLVQALISARSSVTVAINLMGDVHNLKSFEVRGSTKAVQALRKECEAVNQ